MYTFPLVKVKKSNEAVMGAVFIVLLLYHLPQWTEEPVGILRFILLIAVAVLIDIIAGLLRYKRLWCCVSGVVTAAMISLLSGGAPLWTQLLGIVAGLVLGKQLWGGTGKNFLNPAMVGMLVVMLLTEVPYPFFPASWLLLPAMLLSLFFVRIRPFAGIGLMAGMLVSLFLYRELTMMNIITYGVAFWGGLVITDPVTVTHNKPAGLAAGFLAGFGVLFFSSVPIAVVLCILLVNLFSVVIQDITAKSVHSLKASFRIPKAVHSNEDNQKLIDLSGDSSKTKEEELSSLTRVQILDRIKVHQVFGMGGAAFDTHQKIMTAYYYTGKEKHLIVNAVECDPGLIHDAWLLRNYSEEISKGIEALRKCLEFSSIHIAGKDFKGVSFPDNIKLVRVKDRYPIGAERILVNEVLHKQMPLGYIPAMKGILVLNVQTVYAIYQAVYLNKTVDTRLITVADLKQKTAQVVKVKLGMRVKEILEAVYPGAFNLFVGGGIMQAHIADEDTIVDKSINLIATGNYPIFKESPQCSGCGSCSSNCPSGLAVNRIVELVEQGKIEDTLGYHVRECINCASCSYSCPAGRNLARRVKEARDAMMRE
jgi:electron transport complex protein RnfC